ncbi:hypothetical protein, partial [Vibrio diabolicus]|uniref:hypothetical protein n=1 Tax=Vibrio diabolicus TaxID=50719 RepID=UPI0030C841B0
HGLKRLEVENYLCYQISADTIKYNKLFKSDSQRVAFLLCVAFSVSGGMRELRYCVAHTLTGRYVTPIDLNPGDGYQISH